MATTVLTIKTAIYYVDVKERGGGWADLNVLWTYFSPFFLTRVRAGGDWWEARSRGTFSPVPRGRVSHTSRERNKGLLCSLT